MVLLMLGLKTKNILGFMPKQYVSASEACMHYQRSQRTVKLLPTLLSKSAKSAKPPPPLDVLEPNASVAGGTGRAGPCNRKNLRIITNSMQKLLNQLQFCIATK